MPFSSNTASEAGRKSKRGISARAKILDELLQEENAKLVFEQLEQKALSGDMDAIKTYLAYCFGKPEAKIDITTDGEKIGLDLDKLSVPQLKSLWEIKSTIGN